MGLEEIIIWIESTIKFLDSDLKFYNIENDTVSAGFFHQEFIKFKKTLELLKELQVWRTQPEIIHCCECKFFRANMSPDGYIPKGAFEFECKHWNGSCDPTDFCSYGEWKGGD